MDPDRLLDQPDLPAHERAALEAGRDHAPVAYDVAAGAARLADALSTGGASAGAATAASSVAAKLGLKLAVTGVLAALAFVASLQLTTPHRSQTGAERTVPLPSVEPPKAVPAAPPAARVPDAPRVAPPPPVPVQRSTSPVVRAARKPPEREPERAPAPVAAPSALEAPVARPAIVPAPATRELEPQPEAVSAPAPSAAMREMKALARAKRALSEEEPERALSILSDLARDHPRGYFVEERRALRVLALAANGESQRAQREADRFVHDYPNGAFTQRVKAAAR